MPELGTSTRLGSRTIKGAVFAHLDFVLSGVVMTLLGPLLPLLSARWALDDTQAGYLFTAQYIASIGGMLVSAPLVTRYGYRITMIAGLLLMAAGIALLAPAGWIFGLISIGIFGAGFGVTTPAVNLFVSNANPERRASALNLVNSSWGVGAMGCPLLVAMAQRWQRTPLFLYGLSVVLAALAISLTGVLFAVDGEAPMVEENSAAKSAAPLKLWLFVVPVMFFVYVGTENSIGGWVAAYARRIDPGSRAFWAIMPSFFWGALLVGRASAPLALRRLRETRLAATGVALASLGVLALLAAKTATWVACGAAVAGLGLSSVYPIKVSLLPHWLGNRIGPVSGIAFALGNMGGAVLPWVVGLVSTHSGNLRNGFVVPLLGALTMLIFYLAHFWPPREAA